MACYIEYMDGKDIKEDACELSALLSQAGCLEKQCGCGEGSPARFVELYKAYNRLAAYCFAWRDDAGAREYLARQYRILLALLENSPGNTEYAGDLSDCCSDMGDLCVRRGSLHEAIQLYGKAHDISASLYGTEDRNPAYAGSLTAAKERLGDSYLKLGALEKARDFYDAAVRITEKLILRGPFNRGHQIDFSVMLERIAGSMRNAGYEKEAEIYRKWLRESELVKLTDAASR